MPIRLQSAMEYLMTYGWAILIIAIVLGVLYYLGVFGGAIAAPRAQPGNCQVFRPNGPGTSYDVGLSGTCNNEAPEYVAQFNGQNSYIDAGSSPILSPSSQFTIAAWIYVNSFNGMGTGSYEGIVSKDISGGLGTPPYAIGTVSSGVVQASFTSPNNVNPSTPTTTLSTGTWYFIVGTYDGNVLRVYLNGALSSSNSGAYPIGISTGTLKIGQQKAGLSRFFNGSIADIQVYNVSLSANEVEALYVEGIGGVPVNPAYLIGWWPLNGNPNDYSGNQNNGVSTNVIYSSSWTSRYAIP